MSSATVHELHAVDPVTSMINRTIRTLMADRGMSPPELWARASITKGTYYNHMKGRGDWTAPETQRIADALGVDVGVLFNGLGLPRWAPRGSNPQPTGFRNYHPGMATDRSELAGHLLGQPVEHWIADRRASGRSWRQIAKDIDEATAGRIRPTHETVRSWAQGDRQDAA